MKNLKTALRCNPQSLLALCVTVCMLMVATVGNVTGQCVPVPNALTGTVFVDADNNGEFAALEAGQSNVNVTAYLPDGTLAGADVTDADGNFTIADITEGVQYQLIFAHTTNLVDAVAGTDNGTSVQYVSAPACNINYGLTDVSSSCGSTAQVVLSCFVNGEVTVNPTSETIVGLPADFTPTTAVTKYATQAETGTVWGIAVKTKTQEIFSSAFVKFNAGLKEGPYSIFKTDVSSQPTSTSLFADVNTLTGGTLAGLGANDDISDCGFGANVGRVGLGNLIMTPNESMMYVSLLDNNTIVGVSTEDPRAETTTQYTVPRPANLAAGLEYRLFALEWHQGMLYAGVTVTAAESQEGTDSRFVVMTLDPSTGVFDEVFETNVARGFWQDDIPSASIHGHWLTDIAFADEGYMMLGITDRLGHVYCKPEANNRLDQQYPDLLGVYKDSNGEWKLEEAGIIDGMSGSGIGNGDGPTGQGEFFGFEFWPTNPEYHNETALGSIFVIPGTGEVLAAVYDPLVDSYSGGIHRYSTADGSLQGAKQLYRRDFLTQFGKATGFGDIAALCSPASLEIGNYAWIDINGDGQQNAGEPVAAALELNLYNDQCILIGSTTTDENGNYSFNDNNVVAGIDADATYYIEVDNDQMSQESGLYEIGGQEYSLCTRDTQIKADRDCDVLAASDQNCFEGAYIEVNTTNTNHTFDIGFGVPGGFDLALMKTIVGNKFAVDGELITFNITIYNQGGRTASEVTVVDYMPNGYTFDSDENIGWILEDGMLQTVFEEGLSAGANTSRLLRLRVNASHDAEYINVAEIGEARDFSGEVAEDVDSNADQVYDNDNGGVPGTDTDDILTGTGADDEDDSDPAEPQVFDLALRVELADDREYLAGETVKFDVTVFNQGNVAADQYEVVQYPVDGLAYDQTLSTDWALVNGIPTVDIKDNLEPGASRKFCIYYTVGSDINNGAISSYAEIAASTPVGSTESFDIDSTPDATNDNDTGAEAYTVTDNFLGGNATADEDDHDIVVVTTRYVDLALRKGTAKERVSKGDFVTFTIEIHNQGTQPVDQVKLVDYLPEGMVLADDNWTMVTNSIAERVLQLEEPLQQGHMISTEVRTQVLQDAPGFAFVNYAEIASVHNEGVDLSAFDVDSTPDEDSTNDIGGEPGSDNDDMITQVKLVDEDDHDPARVVIVDSRLVTTTCLNNATPSENGTYLDEFEITGPEGDSWFVDFALNYLDAAGVAAVPVGAGGVIFAETSLGDGRSAYTISLQRPAGAVARVDFRNDSDDIQTFETAAENYATILVDGNTAICGGGTFTYTVANPVPGATYTWSLPGEGAFVAANEGTSVEINWDGTAAPAYHEVIVQADGCFSPGRLTVANGEESGAMFCLGHINLSLDADCEVTVNANMVLSGGMPAGTAYSVMLLNEHNEVIPSATLNASHIGMTVTAKVVDGCSGNSCWTTILVEDKLNPTIICEGADLFCNRIGSYGGPVAEDNCGGQVTIALLSDSYTAYTNCDAEFLGEYNRTYQATDEQGNVSEICPVTVRVRRVDLADVAYPADTTVNCGGFVQNDEGFPAPSVTGVPVYNNEEIFPQLDINAPCMIITTYTDVRLPAVGSLGGVIKVMRTWTVYEWCSTPSFRTHTQTIKIRDTTPPVITSCPDDVTVSAATGQCEATFALPLPEAMDECSSFTVTTMYPGGSILGNDSRIISLPASLTPYTITYVVIDEAGFETSCTSQVTVRDDIAPTVFCDGNTTVSLNNNGVAYMFAGVIDDGSYDACGIDSFAIRRMDAAGQCGYDNLLLADRVFFCCEDVGQVNMVQLVVWDVNGNSNSCMVNVDVQDKKAPVISTLADMQIECSDELYPLSQFGTPTFTDACNVSLAIDSIVNVNSCGTGTVTRIFTASDSNGSSTSTQTITIVNSDPFGADDITFLPGDLDFMTTEGNCSLDNLHPDSLVNGRPLFTTDACDLVGAAFEDAVYEIEDACFKIVRTWTILDWCQENDPLYEEFTHVQIIKVTNEVAPTIDTNGPFSVNTTDCTEGFIALSASATDDCSVAGSLDWTAFVYYDQTGVDTQTPDVTFTGTGAVAMADGTYPVGTHFVQWVFTDGCDNSTSVLEEFTIVNITAPELACVNLSVGLGPMDLDMDGTFDSEMACFNVDTMLSLTMGSTFHPCGTPFELSLVEDEIVKKDTFDCSNLGINVITLYAIDIFGNTTSCVFEIDVQDNNDVDVCLDVKDCTDIPTVGDLEVGANCLAVITTTDFDPSQISTECGTLVFTHNLPGTPSTTTLVGAELPVGTTTVTWTITNGNMTETCDVVIEVTDETDPEITCASATLFADTADGVDDCQHTVIGAGIDATATDNCGVASIVHDYASVSSTTLDGAVFPLGSTDVTWTVVDASGNETSCTITVVVTDTTNPELLCGSIFNFDDTDDAAENCSHVVTGIGLDPTATDNCNMTVTLTHDYGSADNTTLDGAVFPLGSTDVTWTATDAAGNSIDCTITIIVEDNVDPELICQPSISIPEEDDAVVDCQYRVSDDAFDAIGSDNCTGFTVEHDYTDAPDANTLDGAVFPIGVTEIVWTVTDNNGNISTCLRTITVTDNTGPDCIAQDTAFVVIDMSGEYELTVGDLSTPLVDACDANLTYSFNPGIIDCDNVGDTLLVGFSAEDTNGNMTPFGCPLVVVVMEAGLPECNPIDITVDLGASGTVFIDPDDVNNVGMSTCGIEPDVTIDPEFFSCNDVGENTVTITVTNGTDIIMCTATVTVTDTVAGPELLCGGNVMITCTELEDIYGGDIDAWMDATPGIININDNCPMTPQNPYDTTESRIIPMENVCGVGQSTRTFTITDLVGLSDQCVQIFTVVAEDPLTQADIDALVLPDTVIVAECLDIDLIQPNNTDIGQITTDSISGVASCFRDSIYFTDTSLSGGAACDDTLTRVWTVIDSCQLDVNDATAGIFELTQIIIINDNTAPVVTGILDIEAIVNPATCTSFIGFDNLAATDCNDIMATNNGEFAINQDSLSPAGDYPVGDYEIVITTTDVCGNTGMDTISLSVIDTTPLAITCQKLFVPIVDDVTLTVTTMPEDYVIVEGNCDNEETLQFSFSDSDINDTIRIWTCAEVDTMIEERVFWYDENGVLIDSCRIQTTPTDPDSLCADMGRVIVAGNILNPAGVGIPSFYVDLEGSGIGMNSDETGTYAFPSMGAGGQYEITPVKDGDDKWGVNTLDLIRIQRHLLGIAPLESPYKLIAADITNDEKVSPSDLLALRKLLLGIDASFTNNTSWRAIDAAYTFPDAQDPWVDAFPEQYKIDNLDTDMFVGFVGVKIGDVDESGQFTNGKGEETRSEALTTYQYETVETQSEVTLVTVLATDTDVTYGAEFELTLETASLVGVTSDFFAAANISYHEVTPGLYRVIVTAPEGVEIEAGQQVLELQVLSDQSWTVADQLVFGTEAQSYLGEELAATAIDFMLQVTAEQEEEQRTFAVMQNRPNPWSANTVISFQIPTAGKVAVTVYDINGRVVYTQAATYEVGVHSIEVGSEDLPQSGIYYYQVNYGKETRQHKMIKID